MMKILALSLLMLSFFSFSNDADINIRYIPIENNEKIKLKNEADYKILYFFSYGCGFCYDFENYKQHFLKNKNDKIDFEHLPITNIPSWNEYTKAFFIAKSLKIDIRRKIFKEVHIKNNKILTKELLFKFFNSNYNINEIEFNKRYNSMLVSFKEKKNEKLADKYGVTGTPTIVVIRRDGKIFKTSPSISGGLRDMMASTIYLVTQPIEDEKQQ